MKKYFDFLGSVVCLALFLFFWNDLSGLLTNGKWEGLFYFLCRYDCLILIDCIAMMFCSIIFIPFAIETIRKHKWKLLLVPILACFLWFAIMMLHLWIVYIFFIR